jgi:hypothetical protein
MTGKNDAFFMAETVSGFERAPLLPQANARGSFDSLSKIERAWIPGDAANCAPPPAFATPQIRGRSVLAYPRRSRIAAGSVSASLTNSSKEAVAIGSIRDIGFCFVVP